jgi:hypothetical protein
MIDIEKIAKEDARSIKEISDLAKQFIVELNGEQAQLQVEEVVPTKESWQVTVSYFHKYTSPNQLQRTLGLKGYREYKKIMIDRKTKHVVGISNWSPERREAA